MKANTLSCRLRREPDGWLRRPQLHGYRPYRSILAM
jgi:hypothetical protein